MKLGHIGLPVADIAVAQKFYDAVAPTLSLNQLAVHDDFVGYGSENSYEFYIHTGKTGVSGLHICFEVNSQEAVEAFYKASLEAGGTDNGAPGVREDYSPTYYAAFVLDPDGNNNEAVYRG
jgi:catechol 2,3-dioxygenase-like lactoylglutathione lyase family enzyme